MAGASGNHLLACGAQLVYEGQALGWAEVVCVDKKMGREFRQTYRLLYTRRCKHSPYEDAPTLAHEIQGKSSMRRFWCSCRAVRIVIVSAFDSSAE